MSLELRSAVSHQSICTLTGGHSSHDLLHSHPLPAPTSGRNTPRHSAPTRLHAYASHPCFSSLQETGKTASSSRGPSPCRPSHGGNGGLSSSACASAATLASLDTAVCPYNDLEEHPGATSSLPGVPEDFDQHYERLELLGQGAYGRVYRCRRLSNGTFAAVKVVPKRRPDRTPEENLRRIACEVELWKQCQGSEYVIKFEGVYQDQESVMLVQELCSGGDLRHVLEGGPLSEKQAAQVMVAVLDVIAAAHASGFLLGDIKPANFMLKEPLIRTTGTPGAAPAQAAQAAPHPHPPMASHEPHAIPAAAAPSSHASHPPLSRHGHNRLGGSGRQPAPAEQWDQPPPIAVRATDFGFSQRCDPCGSALTSAHHLCGSPVYMAPELWSHEVGQPADVWAAGVMMFQLLSGRYPFWDLPAEACANMPMHKVMLGATSAPIMMQHLEGVSKPARDLILAMLDRNSATRITPDQALRHPWFKRTLGYTPAVHPTLPIEDTF